MKNQLCIICVSRKGKRVCKLEHNSLICSICCAKTRTPQCDGCIYYTQGERYSNEKSKNKEKSKEFILKIDPDVDEKVDHALALIENGDIGVIFG